MKYRLSFWLVSAICFITACSSAPGLRASLPQTGQEATSTLPAESPAPTGTMPTGSNLDAEQFDLQLGQAVERRDFEALRAFMLDRFSFVTWNTQLVEVSAEEAMQRLQQTYLAQGSKPAARFDADVPALLEGADPLSVWGPVANPVRALHVQGLGPEAADEAVLVVGQEASTGRLYWLGLLAAPSGSFQVTEPGSEDPLQIEVQYVVAKDVLNVRAGPGMDYDVLGLVRQGEISQVTGKSEDGNWWRIICTQDASGQCWISADPALSEPSPAPQ